MTCRGEDTGPGVLPPGRGDGPHLGEGEKRRKKGKTCKQGKNVLSRKGREHNTRLVSKTLNQTLLMDIDDLFDNQDPIKKC